MFKVYFFYFFPCLVAFAWRVETRNLRLQNGRVFLRHFFHIYIYIYIYIFDNSSFHKDHYDRFRLTCCTADSVGVYVQSERNIHSCHLIGKNDIYIYINVYIMSRSMHTDTYPTFLIIRPYILWFCNSEYALRVHGIWKAYLRHIALAIFCWQRLIHVYRLFQDGICRVTNSYDLT